MLRMCRSINIEEPGILAPRRVRRYTGSLTTSTMPKAGQSTLCHFHNVRSGKKPVVIKLQDKPCNALEVLN